MPTERAELLPRDFPYRSNWRVMGCSFVFFGLLGTIGCALLPFGWEKLQSGLLPLGVAYMVIGLFGIPMVLMAGGTLVTAIRQGIRPPLVRVTASALLVPHNLRKESTPVVHDEHGATMPRPAPVHPEEIPFAAIRSVRREGPRHPGSDRLLIAHALAPCELIVQQFMMRAGDFDALESALRSTIPAAFTPDPPA